MLQKLLRTLAYNLVVLFALVLSQGTAKAGSISAEDFGVFKQERSSRPLSGVTSKKKVYRKKTSRRVVKTRSKKRRIYRKASFKRALKKKRSYKKRRTSYRKRIAKKRIYRRAVSRKRSFKKRRYRRVASRKRTFKKRTYRRVSVRKKTLKRRSRKKFIARRRTTKRRVVRKTVTRNAYKKGHRKRYSGLVAQYARTYGVPVRLADAVVRIESNYRAHIRGRAGEIGLMQIKPATARGMGYRGSTSGLFNPATNIKWGMKYLAGAYRRAGGSICGTVLRYNAGHYAKRMNPISARYCRKARKILSKSKRHAVDL